MNAVGGVEKRCRRPGRSQRRRDLTSDEARFSDARDDYAAFRARDALHCAREVFVDPPLGLAERFGLHPEDATSALDDILAGHRLMRSQISTARSISDAISESGIMFGPSLGAQSGSGWVSRK